MTDVFIIQKASPSCYLWDSLHGSQCPSSLKKTWKIFQASHGTLSNTVQSKVGIQGHNKKNQQPCKTVADNIHNKHNASTLALHVYRTFLNIVWGFVLLNYNRSVSNYYNPFTPLGCRMLYWCIQFLSTIADIHLMHILKTKVPVSEVPRWNVSLGSYNISQKIACWIRFMFKVST